MLQLRLLSTFSSSRRGKGVKSYNTLVQETLECASLEGSCMLSGHTYVSARKKFNILHDFKRSLAELGIGYMSVLF